MKRTGWRSESYRHYLAAKGISTSRKMRVGTKHLAAKGVSTCRRYKAQKDYKATADFLRGMFDDGRAKTEDFGESMRMQSVNTLRNETVDELQQAEVRGDISYDAAQRFMSDDFTDETKDFIDHKIDHQRYRDNVHRRLRAHMRMHGKKLGWTQWMQDGE